MFDLDSKHLVDGVRFGMPRTEIIRVTQKKFRGPPIVFQSSGIEIVDYEDIGIKFGFISNELVSIYFNEPAKLLLGNKEIKLGTVRRDEIEVAYEKMYDLVKYANELYVNKLNLIFGFDDESDHSLLQRVEKIDVTYEEDEIRSASAREQFHEKHGVERVGENSVVGNIAPVINSLLNKNVEHRIKYDNDDETEMVSSWVFANFSMSLRATIETADIEKKYGCVSKFLNSDVVEEQLNHPIDGVVCWFESDYPLIELSSIDFINNLDLFVKIGELGWFVCRSQRRVIEFGSGAEVSYFQNY